jgi:hypothetical protein
MPTDLGFTPKTQEPQDLGFTPKSSGAGNTLGFTPKSGTPSNSAPLDYSPATYKMLSQKIGYSALPVLDNLKPIALKAAQKYGVDPRLVESFISAESTGGRNPGTSSAGAMGVMQIMPKNATRYGYKPEDRTDPDKNIDMGVHLLADNIKATGGDIYKAAAMYNSGSASSDFNKLPIETQQYLAKIYTGLNPDSPVETEKKHALQVIHAVAHGQSASHILSHTPETRPLAQAMLTLQQHRIWASQHSGEEALDILGSGQRAVAGFARAVQDHEDFQKGLKEVKNAVFHPDQHEQEKLDEATRKLFGAPDPYQQRVVLEHKFGKERGDLLAVAAQSAESFTMQTLTDPLSALGPLEKLLGISVSGLAAARAGKLADAIGQTKIFKPYADAVKTAGAKLFQPRPELDHIFTQEGKKARIAIENKHLAVEAMNEKRDQVAKTAEDATKSRILEYFAQHGTAKTQQEAIKLSGGVLDPAKYAKVKATGVLSAGQGGLKTLLAGVANSTEEEREEMLHGFREHITHTMIERLTKQYVTDHGGLQEGVKVADAIKQGYHPKYLMGTGGKFVESYITRPLAELAKATVQFNPLPHAVKNVGQLAYLAGGPEVLPRALYWAAKSARGDVSKEVIRHMQIGTHTEYGGITHNLFDNIPVLKQYLAANTKFMNHMEFGWRQALLEGLDQRLGKSSNRKDELMKGWMVNDALGDYRNTSAFVQLFHMLGGPFVAFRLGIVPKAVGHALADAPQRVESILRVQQDINTAQQGQNNSLQTGGPVQDFAQMTQNPSQYFTSQASAGAVNLLLSLSDMWSGKSNQALPDFMAGLARNYLGPADLFMQASQIIEGHAMPKGPKGYQLMSPSDKLAMSFLAAFGNYIKREETPKQLHKQEKTLKRKYYK